MKSNSIKFLPGETHSLILDILDGGQSAVSISTSISSGFASSGERALGSALKTTAGSWPLGGPGSLKILASVQGGTKESFSNIPTLGVLSVTSGYKTENPGYWEF